jgi:lipopolysaccharide transport system permease protein
MSSDGVPYPVWNFAGLVPWLFFANSLVLSSNSLVGNANLVKKVYFPRLIIPISTIGAGLVDFCITFFVLLGIMGYYHIVPTMQIIWLPFFVLLALTTSLGVGLWLTALNVEYRDVRFAVPFLIQFWMFASPVVYSSSLLAKHPEWQTLYALNPMVGVIEGFRWALLGTNTQPGPMVFVSALSALVVLVTGAFYFKRMERNFADVI